MFAVRNVSGSGYPVEITNILTHYSSFDFVKKWSDSKLLNLRMNFSAHDSFFIFAWFEFFLVQILIFVYFISVRVDRGVEQILLKEQRYRKEINVKSLYFPGLKIITNSKLNGIVGIIKGITAKFVFSWT